MEGKGWQQLRANAKNGISMAVVLCVSAFFIAFAAAILYTAGMLTAQSNQRLKEERCYQLAKSYSDVLKGELTKYSQRYTESDQNAQAGTFYAFANKFLDEEKYLEYNSDYEDSTKYHFVVNGSTKSENSSTLDMTQSPFTQKGYGNLSVTLKKEQNSDENADDLLKGGTIPANMSGADFTARINALEATTVNQYILTVEVTAYYEDASYTYSTEYTRAERYPVAFTHNGKNIVWVVDGTGGGSWKVGNTAGDNYKIEGDNPIEYTYLKNTPTSSVFKENIYQEGGGTNASN